MMKYIIFIVALFAHLFNKSFENHRIDFSKIYIAFPKTDFY